MQEQHVGLASYEEQRQASMETEAEKEVHGQECGYAIKAFVMHYIGAARRFHRNMLAGRVANERCLDELTATSLIYVCPQCYRYTATAFRPCRCGYRKGAVIIKATFPLCLIKEEE